jgi:hypothetical protein
MRTIPVLSLLLLGLVSTALAQQRFQPSDSPNVTVTVTTPAGSDVFFAVNGSDSNPCTQAAPCQTLGKASSFSYQPGTTINFRGGDTFLGELPLTRAQVPSGGDPNNPIIIQSYGTGRATIASNQDGVNANNLGAKNWAILVDCTSGVTVQDLNVTANGHYVQYGIIIQNRCGQWTPHHDFQEQQAAGMIHNLIVQRVDVGGFAIRAPVGFGDAGAQVFIAGFTEVIQRGLCGPINNVQVLDSKFHGNDGISSQVDNGVSTKTCGNLWNFTYRGNEIWNIGGVTGVPITGNALFMQGVTNGLMEHNHAHHLMNNISGCGGPVAIWAYQANHITIQFNEVDHIGPPSYLYDACDFGAFDFDSGVTDSVMQYNYSHDNYGPAWLSFQSGGNHIIRYNLSVNDNWSGNDGGAVAILNADAGPVQFYNNVIVAPPRVACWGTATTPPSGSILLNNICIGTEANQDGHWFAAGSLFGAGDFSHIDMRNNIYWFIGTSGTGPLFTGNAWNLAQWQANMGKDQNSLNVDPRLVNNSGIPTTITWDPLQHTGPQPQPTSEQLRAGSLAIGAGVAVTNNGGRDYWGNAISSPPNIGAYNGPTQ